MTTLNHTFTLITPHPKQKPSPHPGNNTGGERRPEQRSFAAARRIAHANALRPRDRTLPRAGCVASCLRLPYSVSGTDIAYARP
eukprot:581085-Rhodomonas_salina.1